MMEIIFDYCWIEFRVAPTMLRIKAEKTWEMKAVNDVC